MLVSLTLISYNQTFLFFCNALAVNGKLHLPFNLITLPWWTWYQTLKTNSERNNSNSKELVCLFFADGILDWLVVIVVDKVANVCWCHLKGLSKSSFWQTAVQDAPLINIHLTQTRKAVLYFYPIAIESFLIPSDFQPCPWQLIGNMVPYIRPIYQFDSIAAVPKRFAPPVRCYLLTYSRHPLLQLSVSLYLSENDTFWILFMANNVTALRDMQLLYTVHLLQLDFAVCIK